VLDHETVINEVCALEVSLILLCTITSFLSGRQQYAQLENRETSNFQNITRGAVQGSQLGPILFVIVINRLMKQNKQWYKSADDLSLCLLHFLLQTPSQLIPLVAEHQHQADQGKLQLSLNKSCAMSVNFLKKKKSIDESAAL